mmetsp:Transcript_19990/g.61849  ORF Transcript_19990/g.61849 Transcript_19990/m.61849 type:complete len:290 (-) Transcript_19990:975-1844(-)
MLFTLFCHTKFRSEQQEGEQQLNETKLTRAFYGLRRCGKEDGRRRRALYGGGGSKKRRRRQTTTRKKKRKALGFGGDVEGLDGEVVFDVLGVGGLVAHGDVHVGGVDDGVGEVVFEEVAGHGGFFGDEFEVGAHGADGEVGEVAAVDVEAHPGDHGGGAFEVLGDEALRPFRGAGVVGREAVEAVREGADRGGRRVGSRVQRFVVRKPARGLPRVRVQRRRQSVRQVAPLVRGLHQRAGLAVHGEVAFVGGHVDVGVVQSGVADFEVGRVGGGHEPLRREGLVRAEGAV